MHVEPTVADRIRKLLPELPAAELRVARVLLANYPVAGLETIAKVAKRAGSSGPTVLRLTSRLGLSSYHDLQQLLRDEVDARQRSPLELYGSFPASEDGVVAAAAATFTESVAASLARIEQVEFDRAVALLTQPRSRIHVAGGRVSGILADYLAIRLQELRPGVSAAHLTDRAPALLDMTRRDVVVAFDFRRYQADVVNFGRLAVDQGAQLVLFTDLWLSPLATVADVVFTCEVSAPSPYDSLVSATAAVETLIAGIIAALGDTPRERLARFDELWLTQYRNLDD